MKIIITMEVDPEFEDPDHETGVTEHGYREIADTLMPLGAVLDVARAD